MRYKTQITRSLACVAICTLGAPLRVALAETVYLPSPKGGVVLQLDTDQEGHLVYQVTQSGRARIESSRVGVAIDGIDWGANVGIDRPESKTIHETFPRLGVKCQGTNHCRQYQVPIRAKSGGRAWIFEVRVFDDGVGFRCRIPGPGPRRIQGESTSWQIPAGSVVWYQTDTVNYKGAYQSSPPEAIPVEFRDAKGTRPLFIGPPMTIVFADGQYGMLTEAALYNYSGLALSRPAPGFCGRPSCMIPTAGNTRAPCCHHGECCCWPRILTP